MDAAVGVGRRLEITTAADHAAATVLVGVFKCDPVHFGAARFTNLQAKTASTHERTATNPNDARQQYGPDSTDIAHGTFRREFHWERFPTRSAEWIYGKTGPGVMEAWTG